MIGDGLRDYASAGSQGITAAPVTEHPNGIVEAVTTHIEALISQIEERAKMNEMRRDDITSALNADYEALNVLRDARVNLRQHSMYQPQPVSTRDLPKQAKY